MRVSRNASNNVHEISDILMSNLKSACKSYFASLVKLNMQFFMKKRKNLYEWVQFRRFSDDACIYP